VGARLGLLGGRTTAPGGLDAHNVPVGIAISSSRGAHSMTRLRTTLAFLATSTLVATSLIGLTGSTAAAAPFGYNQLNSIQKHLVSGLLAAELNPADLAGRSRTKAPSAVRRTNTAAACTNRFGDKSWADSITPNGFTRGTAFHPPPQY